MNYTTAMIKQMSAGRKKNCIPKVIAYPILESNKSTLLLTQNNLGGTSSAQPVKPIIIPIIAQIPPNIHIVENSIGWSTEAST